MDKINAYFPVSGYDDLTALFWACFYTVSAAILFGGLILQPIAEKLHKKSLASWEAKNPAAGKSGFLERGSR